MEQRVLKDYQELYSFLKEKNCRKILLVSGRAMEDEKLNSYFSSLDDIDVVRFSDYKPNPAYESCVQGTKLYLKENCDCIIAIGGGSCMDTAKCIKLFANMDQDIDYLKQEIVANEIPFIAIPTTAGTGSEATRFAIIYVNGNKQSISDYSCIPEAVLFDPSLLKNLPDYQKKATMLDALSHAIESYWAVKANDESRGYADEAIRLVYQYKDSYLNNEEEGLAGMLKAAYIAGKAINITQTTAGHAMCYKITSKYHAAHGHSVALVMTKLFPYVVEHTSDTNDPRGEGYLKDTLRKIAEAMGCEDAKEAADRFNELVKELEMSVPKAEEGDYEVLRNSVNPDRLMNNPVSLNIETIDDLYHQILS